MILWYATLVWPPILTWFEAVVLLLLQWRDWYLCSDDYWYGIIIEDDVLYNPPLSNYCIVWYSVIFSDLLLILFIDDGHYSRRYCVDVLLWHSGDIVTLTDHLLNWPDTIVFRTNWPYYWLSWALFWRIDVVLFVTSSVRYCVNGQYC